jgi:membrane-associated phospholipid phosphatase
MTLDPTEAGYFRNTSTFQRFNNIFSGNATAVGIILAPVSLYAAGRIRRDSKMQQTALLAGEAVADAAIVTTVFKDATERVRPAGFPAQGNLYDSWFENRGSFLRGNGSFPSGHTIAAFSVATVVARRYGNHRWIPYVAYGAAALVGFSRLSLSAHFLSDVFIGGALGYSISRLTVLRQKQVCTLTDDLVLMSGGLLAQLTSVNRNPPCDAGRKRWCRAFSAAAGGASHASQPAARDRAVAARPRFRRRGAACSRRTWLRSAPPRAEFGQTRERRAIRPREGIPRKTCYILAEIDG